MKFLYQSNAHLSAFYTKKIFSKKIYKPLKNGNFPPGFDEILEFCQLSSVVVAMLNDSCLLGIMNWSIA